MGAVKLQLVFQSICTLISWWRMKEYPFSDISNIFSSAGYVTLHYVTLCYVFASQKPNTDICQTGLSPAFFYWLWRRQSGFIPLISFQSNHAFTLPKPLHLISSIWTKYSSNVEALRNGVSLLWKRSKTWPYQPRTYKSVFQLIWPWPVTLCLSLLHSQKCIQFLS